MDETALLDSLPHDTTPDGIDGWVRNIRALFRSLWNTYLAQDGLDVLNGTDFVFLPDDGWFISVSDSYESFSFRTVTLEFDLDHMLLLYAGCPVCPLDRPPPPDLWHIFRDCTEPSGRFDYWEFYEKMPPEFTFDITRLQAPPIANRPLVFYEKHFTRTFTTPRDILSAREQLSDCDETRLNFAAMHAEFYAKYRYGMVHQEMAFVDNRESIGWNGREIACLLAAVTLVPLHILGPPSDEVNSPWYKMFSQASNDFWYLRKHICVTLATTHILDERNAKSHISRLVQDILSPSSQDCTAPRVVYGVVLSLFHCIVVRVDKAAGGTFTRTEPLEFLPHPSPSHPEAHWHTPGLELLTRLGNMRALDDIEFFHRNLASRWWKDSTSLFCEYRSPKPSTRRKPMPAAFPRGPRVPPELLYHIAEGIEDPNTLCDFALAATATMRAAIHRLRLPQVRGNDLAWSKKPYLSLRSGLILEGVDIPAPPRVRRGDDKGYPTMFGVQYLDFHGHVMIQPALWTQECNDCRDNGHFMDLLATRRQTLPRAPLRYRATSGRGRPPGAHRSGVPDGEDPVIYWKHNRRYMHNPHIDLSFMMVWGSDCYEILASSGYDADDESSGDEDEEAET